MYGNTNCDDMAVWESLHPECHGRQLFGVGSSDPHFVMTGTPSSTASVSLVDARQSHEVVFILFLLCYYYLAIVVSGLGGPV